MRVMVRPLLHGISKLSKMAGTDPLDKDEMTSGEVAWAALAYQYGAMMDARVLVGLWLAGVTIPRAIQYMEKRVTQQREEMARQNSAHVMSAEKEREVKGQVTAIIPNVQ